jgi:AcrR family transcriptional regulator
MDLQPAEQRRLQQREDVRRAILDATEALLLEGGYDGFSIRRLTKRCGYTAPTIYHHFGDKTGLIDALLDARFGRILEHLRRVPRASDPAVYLRELARAFVRSCLESATHYRLLTMPRLESQTEQLPSAEEARELVERAFRELARQGRLTVTDIDAAFQSTWSLLHGLISLRISRPDYPWAESLVEVALDALQRGLIRENGDGAC